MRTPVLETERLILRPLTAADTEAVWLWASDAIVNKFMNYPLHKTREDTVDFLQREEQALDSDSLYDFGFVIKETGELIGSGGISYNKEYKIWELGYNLRQDCWNQGYATEAAARIIKFGVDELKIERVLGRHAVDNPASGKVMEKNGFMFVRNGSYQKFDGSQTFKSREYILETGCRKEGKEKTMEKNSRLQEIERFYDEQYEEWERLEWHLPEFEVTKRYMLKYITGNKKVLDIGGGPGRYSIFLAQQGHEVTLLDLSGKNIRQAINKAEEAGVHLDSCIHGNALWLHEYLYREEQYDVVLLMGPLYHLLQEEDRIQALKEAMRMLKPGGIMIAAFISSYAPIQDYASDLSDYGDIDHLLNYLNDGRNHAEDAAEFTTSYFSSREEARALMESAGLKELVFAGVENILCGKEKMLHALSDEQREKWLELAWRLSGDEKLLGMSEHFLYIGEKSAIF
ncbi:MAG: GNAT family N-acetyltransferase [Lachnospiraceae bacterium]|nr:GNAT family N-acetyltransferase [Lachnospiraceae bacterium]